jgi:outer membrane protein OmpA-like peptidoglycan-associated protein
MSKTFNRYLYGVLALLVLASSAAMAAPTEEGSWEFGPYVGWVKWDDYGLFKPQDDNLYGFRVGGFLTSNFSAEGSYQKDLTETDRFAHAFNLSSVRLNLLWNFRAGEMVRPFLTVGADYDSLKTDDFRAQHSNAGNIGGGVRLILNDYAGIRLDARYVYHRLERGFGKDQANYELMAGVSFMPGGGPPKDSDHDGVRDSRDKCPDTPAGATVDERGCPKDSDGDGVLDGIDACPDTPKGWPVDAKGCPIDTDGDGVPDGKDRCPDTPHGAKVDENGCPIDSDGDGVFDGIDACPDTPKGWKVDAKGCPLDSDGDGVPDGRDKCPDTPHGVTVDADGCPPPPPPPKSEPLFTAEKKVLILEGVNFETDKWNLLPESTTVLDRVAASLKDWPDVRVEVGGHTDSTGGDAHNMTLSQKRAESVRDYLISKGVPEGQMTAKGYGKTKPIADNTTKAGRAKNRRTELTKIE